jgi:S-adenosylmethionine:tRNA ribosyltransferase-isomerase
MTAAHLPIQRPPLAKLLVVDARGNIEHWQRSRFADLMNPGDLVVANDAATLPASLSGRHVRSGQFIEVRLARRQSLAPEGIRHCAAVVFGTGDYRTRTEDRPLPPWLEAGDQLMLGPLRAVVKSVLGHPRLVELTFEGSLDEIWAALSRHGRPIQYSHVRTPLELWDVWTSIAGLPVAFEPPSAGFALDWATLASLKQREVRFATITHAAGISSTGDAGLDSLLPLDEPYSIPWRTSLEVQGGRRRNRRIVAVGTTIVRALEHATQKDGSVRVGDGVATQRIGRGTCLQTVDAVLSGTHEPGTSHYELLHAFLDQETLRRIDRELDQQHYLTHEFGDSVFIERRR